MPYSVRRYRLDCRDLGIDDDFFSSGKTKSDVMAKMLRYLFRVHGIRPNEVVFLMRRKMKCF